MGLTSEQPRGDPLAVKWDVKQGEGILISHRCSFLRLRRY